MNIKQEEEAIKKLSPKQYYTRNLVIAIVTLSSVVATIWGLDRRSLTGTISTLRESGSAKNETIKELGKSVSDCEKENARIMRENNEEQVRYERERARRADSISIALLAAERAVKKAIK